MYTMAMIKEYKSIPDFRQHLREAFNAAENGEIVTITRFKHTFILVDPEQEDMGKIIHAKIGSKEHKA